MKKFILKNYKLVIAFLLGGVIFNFVGYAVTIHGKDVSYDNTVSEISSTNVQGAIDELYTKSKFCTFS